MKAFILFAVIVVAFAREQCGENEHYTGCGTDCPLTCDNYDNPPLICNRMCRIGCECDKGFVRSSDGRCVRPEQCPPRSPQPKCGENEHFNSCGTDCPLTCDNYANPPKFCNLMCRIGCECDEGYVRSSDGRCVKPEQCPARFQEQECGANQHYTTCGTSCPLTCDNYSNPPKICNLRCNIGCACDEGFVLTRDGKCIRPFQCPQNVSMQCGENEHFNSCGTDCPLTCDNYANPPKFCNLMCRIGCECNEGYVRSSDGSCVRPEQCAAKAPECGANQHFTTCGTSCPLTCDNYSNPPKICNLRCNIGCVCDEGFVLTRDGKCIRPFQCPQNVSLPEVETCREEPDKGHCLGYFPMWYYDVERQECRKFIYGGCQGNGNRYESEERCYHRCHGVKPYPAPEPVPSSCTLPAETGVCRGRFPRYFYDVQTGNCQDFVYGGCGGNENNFETVEECQSTCAPQRAPQACLLEKVTGPCKARMIRYYFNKQSGQCEEFVYGGCSGNSNNFHTKDDCEAVCSN